MYAQGWAGWFDLAIIRLRWTELLGMATAVISGVAAAVSFLDANETPQKRWFKARSQAEALRSIYFLFLARQKPYDTLNTGERVQIMRMRVLEVLRGGTRASGSDQGSALDAPTPEEDAEAAAAEAPTRRTNPPSGS
jgi:hypothetical protein